MSYVHNIIIYMIFVYTIYIYICYRLYCSMLQINHMIQKRSREYSRESLNVRPNSSEVYNWWDNLTQLSSCRSPAAQHLGFDSYGDLVPSEFMVSTPLIRGTSDDPGLFNKSLQCFMFNKKKHVICIDFGKTSTQNTWESMDDRFHWFFDVCGASPLNHLGHLGHCARNNYGGGQKGH